MIQVSNEFKKAIKSPERKIKGYVEVLYDLPNLETTVSSSMSSTYTNESEISNGIRVENLYGSLDYLPLDGTRLVMSETNANSGFISDKLFAAYNYPTITLNFNQTTINGITMYFKINYPTNLSLNYSDGTQENISNNKEILQIIFNQPKTLTSLTITFNDMKYEDRKIYIDEIDLGVTQVYKDQDLIEFTVDEEVNKLVEEVPINETNITLNNMSDLFNPLNPSGIVPYLSENTVIKPYIGVLTENLGVEYVKMGEFYFDSYTNNSDATTTLVGKNIINQLQKELIKDDNGASFLSVSLNQNRFQNFMNNYNYVFNVINWNRSPVSIGWKSANLIDLLKDLAFTQWNILYADRNNKLNLKLVDTSMKDTLTKTELIDDAQYMKIDKINTVYLNRTVMSDSNPVDSRQILKQDVVLTKSTEYFIFTSDNPALFGGTISQSGGTSATIINIGYYMVVVRITGTVGNTVTITIDSATSMEASTQKVVLSNKRNEREISIEFDSPFNALYQTYIDNSKILEYAPSYEMRFEYNGDPSLEAGDYINVETPYGYKKLFIQKNRFKFDGGLEGSIEGVE